MWNFLVFLLLVEFGLMLISCNVCLGFKIILIYILYDVFSTVSMFEFCGLNVWMSFVWLFKVWVIICVMFDFVVWCLFKLYLFLFVLIITSTCICKSYRIAAGYWLSNMLLNVEWLDFFNLDVESIVLWISFCIVFVDIFVIIFICL